MPDSDLETLFNDLELQCKRLKEDIYTISWYMRGGITAQELLHIYTPEDRMIMNEIIKNNIELTKKSGLPLV